MHVRTQQGSMPTKSRVGERERMKWIVVRHPFHSMQPWKINTLQSSMCVVPYADPGSHRVSGCCHYPPQNRSEIEGITGRCDLSMFASLISVESRSDTNTCIFIHETIVPPHRALLQPVEWKQWCVPCFTDDGQRRDLEKGCSSEYWLWVQNYQAVLFYASYSILNIKSVFSWS